jgi:metal-responsive CopG/Arc/MetJ family transcriptional regulator
MAKVLVSFPDDLLLRVDKQASRAGESRSGFFQRLAERELEAGERQGREEAKRLMDLIRAEFRDDEPPMDAARLIREDRESH